MKRKVIIAATTAAVLVGGGAATAVGATSGSGGDQDAKAASSGVLAGDDAHSHRDAQQRHGNSSTDAADDALDEDSPDGLRGDDDSDATDAADNGAVHEHDDGTARDNAADRDEDTGNAGVSLRQASEAVQKAAPGLLTELELDTDNNKLVWEADVLGKDRAWHKVDIDATTGKVLHNRVDQDDDGTPRTPKIDAMAAAQKAASTTNGSVTSLDLESNGSRWEVDTVGKNGTEHEVDIDATTGKVLQHQSEPADDDDD